MDRKEIIGRIKRTLIKQGNIEDASKINLDSDLSKDLGLDSLDKIETVMRLEEEFGLSIGDNEQAKLKTVADIVNKVEYHMAGKG